MASATKTHNTANSGIRKLSNGDSIIPSSTRADGSVRKQIRVKPGYKPPEDVEVYKNRTAEAWKNRGKGGVPGAQAADENDVESSQKAAANKNAKRREARKRAAAAAAAEGQGGELEVVGEAPEDGNGLNAGGEAVGEDVNPEAETTKEARKLAKKLRQARELKEKKEKGDSLLPEQFAKVIKINELIRQLESLGFDADGEKMASEGAIDQDGV